MTSSHKKSVELIKGEEEEKEEILVDYLGFLGVIIALVMTIVWDSLKAQNPGSQIFIGLSVYYVTCLTILGLICIFYWAKYAQRLRIIEIIESNIFMPFALFAILAGVLPILSLGDLALISTFAAFILLGTLIVIGYGSYLVLERALKTLKQTDRVTKEDS